MNRHVLSILVDNQPGVLSRVTGLFSRRGYNIASLSVGVTENEEVSRITVVVFCDDADCEQITKQVEKLIDVIRVVELSQERAILIISERISPRQLTLIKASSRNTPLS